MTRPKVRVAQVGVIEAVHGNAPLIHHRGTAQTLRIQQEDATRAHGSRPPSNLGSTLGPRGAASRVLRVTP